MSGRFQTRLILLASLATLPAVLTAIVLLWLVDFPTQVRIAIAIFVVASTALLVSFLRDRILYTLRTMANLVGAIREHDYSLRARHEDETDPLGELAIEINQLGAELRRERRQNFEALALVRTIVAQLDFAIFAFGPDERLRMVNPAGERLLDAPAARLLGRTVDQLGLRAAFDESRAEGKWSVRKTSFIENGRTHHLLTVSDVKRALRDEELLAWQRLVRVIGHELNNSLAPIRAVADGLRRILARETLPPDWRTDAQDGLEIIGSRVDALTRFTQSYARLARLPQPVLAPVDLEPIVRRVASLPFATNVTVKPGSEVILMADADQIEQVLVNLVQNAVDASAETGGTVTVTWEVRARDVELRIVDEGPGLSGTLNLFVPFFTTKPGGTGIGLVLSRQIAEAHGGNFSLESRRDASGCEAVLVLPLRSGVRRP
jgi:nitrogen fixation/metabolism regulation signal transduction histidine kinase